jgi:hypothetical protein
VPGEGRQAKKRTHHATFVRSSAAASQTALPAHRQQAPIGHRQPNAASVPASPNEPSMTLEDVDIDNKLNICRGC